MTTRPRVTLTEVDTAVIRITDRHRQADDQHLERLGTDPRDVHDYLARYTGPHLPAWVRRADIADDLVLQVWLWWEDQRRLLATRLRGRRLGCSLSQLGGPLGLRSPQGTQDLIDRLTALLRYDRPNEKVSREERHLQATTIGSVDDDRHRWITTHTTQLGEVTTRLLAEADQWQVTDREWLDELAHDHQTGGFTPASMAVLGLALGELRTTQALAEVDPSRPVHPSHPLHQVHRVLAAGDRLRAAYALVGLRSG
ncbi:MAG: hypothetical protein ACRDZY_19155 [Acidimicrobiales bacterium]